MCNKTKEDLLEETLAEIGCEIFSNQHIEEHIEHCERVYQMRTEDFIKWFEEQGCEGNVDMKRWYKYVKS